VRQSRPRPNDSNGSALRWIAISVFVLMNVLNFLDRGLLSANGPTVKSEFTLSNTQYAEMISAFSIIYALVAPFAGALLDRMGLTRTVGAAVVTWSLGSAATGITRTFRGLLLSRAVLGVGEAAALPCLSKASALYLPPAEWGLANAVGSITVTAGIVAAPLLAAIMSPRYGWRSAFILSGVLGIIWVALWLFSSRLIPPATGSRKRTLFAEDKEDAQGSASLGNSTILCAGDGAVHVLAKLDNDLSRTGTSHNNNGSKLVFRVDSSALGHPWRFFEWRLGFSLDSRRR
jgi:MFS family permease